MKNEAWLFILLCYLFFSMILKVKIRSVRLDAVAKIGWRRPIYGAV